MGLVIEDVLALAEAKGWPPIRSASQLHIRSGKHSWDEWASVPRTDDALRWAMDNLRAVAAPDRPEGDTAAFSVAPEWLHEQAVELAHYIRSGNVLDAIRQLRHFPREHYDDLMRHAWILIDQEASCQGDTPSQQTAPTVGTDDLPALCAAWQERLGLRDWHVTVIAAQPYELGRLQRSADINYEPGLRHARLSVLHPDHVAPDAIAPHDVEEALVHELLHLHMSLFRAPPEKPKGIALEQALNAIAHALVTLKRGGAAV